MNNILKVSLIVIAVLAIAGGLLFAGGLAGAFWSQRAANGFVPGRGNVPGQGNVPGRGNVPGQGMMNPGGGNNGQIPQGGGQNGRGNPGNIPGGGPGMRGMPGNRNQANATPLTTDEAKQAAQAYIKTLNLDGLQVGTVLIFDNGAYVAVTETATGNGAFELRVDPFNKTAYPEMGPNSMWNLKYGGVIQAGAMNGRGYGRGMMRGGRNNPNAAPTATPGATAAPAVTPANVSADMPIAQDQAIKDAQAFLDKADPGATASTTAVKFYGYYTLAFSKDGKVAGIISVNGYNGQVFPQNAYGTFIQEAK
ncbi:MAG: hypothetical protein WA821_23100 [Anaerolineales bacterium]